MLHKNSQPPPEDEWTGLLRASVRRKRPWTWLSLTITLLVLAIPVGLIVWWIFPTPGPPALKLTAFDALSQPAEKVNLRARLETEDPATEADLSKHELQFETGPLGKSQILGKATTTKTGDAEISWSTPNALTAFTVRFPGDKHRRGASAEARLYCWPAETQLLVVDVAALTNANAQTWRDVNIWEITPVPLAAKSLQMAQAHNFRIVYLVEEIDGSSYFKMAAWVKEPGTRHGFPAGPVLGGKPGAVQEAIQDVPGRFAGPHGGVTARADLAEKMHLAGLPVLFLGAQAPRADITAVPSWDDVPGKLPVKK